MKILALGPAQDALSAKTGTRAKRGSGALGINAGTRVKYEYKHPC